MSGAFLGVWGGLPAAREAVEISFDFVTIRCELEIQIFLAWVEISA
jgi:hypothetical protein